MTRLSIEPGAGGIEARCWSEKLRYMYIAWACRLDFSVSSDGEALLIDCPHSLAREAGVHSRTRISPFDEAGRRQTSFALVKVNGEGDWNKRVRSYIEDPYTRVKDFITGVETPDVADVFEGFIDEFLNG